MRIVRAKADMKYLSQSWRRQDKTIGLVPTMGYFHEGHLSLMRESRNRDDILVVSIFVNPKQFGQGEDYQSYPRNLAGDLVKSLSVPVDVAFCPSVQEIYPQRFDTFVEVDELAKYLCGPFRPGHFRGVATVVAKLFNIVKPHRAYFGKKDYQQWLIVRKMAQDLDFDIEIVGLPIIREPDGLAMSSRNEYLSSAERKAACCLSRSLNSAKESVSKGERRTGALIDAMKKIIARERLVALEYVSVCDPQTLAPISYIDKSALIALAARVGKARLIDNVVVEAGS